MPITLAQAAVNTQNDIDYAVIDNLRRTSWLMDQIVFDDTVNPGTGGGTMTYGYTRLTAAASAAFRALNTEYTPGQAARTRYTVDLKPLGGAFTVDRVLANLGGAQTNEINFQMQQLLLSIRTRFQQEVILGDTAVDANGFDGLSKSLTGTSTENSTGGAGVAWSTVATQVAAQQALDILDELLSRIVPSTVGGGDIGAPGALPVGVKAILGNTKSIHQLKRLARWSSMATSQQDSMGRRVDMYGDWVLVNIGDRQDGSGPIIPIASNLADVYAVTFGLDSFHGASLGGSPLMHAALPDFGTAGAVKSGEVEMGPIAMVLRNTKAAAVLRGVQVQ